MSYETNKRDLERSVQKYQSESTWRQIQKEQQEKEEEIQKQKRDEENADNAEYQVNRWYNTYVQLKDKSVLTFRMTQPQINQLKRDMKEAKESLLLWINKRSEELAEKRDRAAAEGNTADVDYYNNEIEKITRKADIIGENDDEF